MKSNNFSPNSYEDETSDTLSTANSYMPAEASSFYQQFSEIPEPDLISPQNKIIRKKRNAYGKIDDDKRLKLLEAVQNGETLKSASKRLGINYSSAKSIIHTYRKEGRILKKSICSFSCPPIHLTQFGNALSAQNPHAQTSGTFSPFEFYPASGSATSFATPTSSSAAYGTSGALGHLALENQYSFEEPAPVNTQTSSFESIVQSSLKSTPLQPIEPVSPRVSIMHLEETATNSWGLLKNFDFYMNYSNSPLSGGKGNIYNGFSDSNNHKMNPREFESFSELINSFQDPNRVEEQAFKSTRFNSIQETKLMEESFAVNNNMTREDYRNLIESQCLLSDSLQKASYLNSLARFQNAAVSPINGWKQL